ncbi:hypothetical protein [Streptomyces profundus]|uniref:hypothetical protein n=1 Tax=Streptomyces profundus TaxID=2867410 RepID=UPI001D16A00F|nr:hypothetical protein [Streptomyces sp. MA3_2.13]UED88114.1 hypothetical protein K4G22_31165 [Streptomyces sp. MA3_2.13]
MPPPDSSTGVRRVLRSDDEAAGGVSAVERAEPPEGGACGTARSGPGQDLAPLLRLRVREVNRRSDFNRRSRGVG